MHTTPPEPLPFRVQVRGTCPPLARLSLALAREFRPVDLLGADAELHRLGGLISIASPREGHGRLEAVAEVLGLCEGYTAAIGHDPEDLLLDTALAQRAGHPAALVCLYVAAAARASIELRPVVSEGRVMVALPEGGPALDPARPGELSQPGEDARWRCSHQVAFALLNELVERYALCGDLRNATRAAELRLHLPVEDPVRDRLAYEVRGLLAALN